MKKIVIWVVVSFAALVLIAGYFFTNGMSRPVSTQQNELLGGTAQTHRSNEDEDLWRVQGVSLLSNAWEKFTNSTGNQCPLALIELRPYLSETFIRLEYPIGQPFSYKTDDEEDCRLCVPLIVSGDEYCVDSKKGRGLKSEIDSRTTSLSQPI